MHRLRHWGLLHRPSRNTTPMRFPITEPRSLFRRKTVKDDAMAGLILGVESVPDGLASGLLAGVNPVAGLYAYLFGVFGGRPVHQHRVHGGPGHRRHGDHRRRRRPRRPRGSRPGAVHALDPDRHRHDRRRPARSRDVSALRVQLGDDRVHHRGRHQHRAGPTGRLHGLRGERGQPCHRAFDLVFNFWKVDLATVDGRRDHRSC